MPTFKMQTSDSELFDVDYDLFKCSETIMRMICADINVEFAGCEDPVELKYVNSATMRKIIEWAEHHKDDPEPSTKDDEKVGRSDDISSWDADFLNVDQAMLFDIILAANFLGMKNLLDTSCKVVANLIKGKTAEEIRETFNIENDFTAEEEEQIRRENEWCEDK